jgi:hypothetical protein
MPDISRLASLIRDSITSRRRVQALIQVRPDWNRLTSALEVIGDTEMAFDAYLEHLHDPAESGDL